VTDYVVDRGMASGGEEIRERATEQLRDSARAAVAVPPRLDDALAKVERGDLALQTALEDDRGAFVRMARRLVGGFLLSITFPVIASLYALGAGRLALVATALAGLITLALGWSFRRRRGLGFGATPQFTRQEMRRRQGGGDE